MDPRFFFFSFLAKLDSEREGLKNAEDGYTPTSARTQKNAQKSGLCLSVFTADLDLMSYN